MENKARKKPSRADYISHIPITLTSVNPFERLKELALQGKYRYRFQWDRFANGFMMDCSLSYFYRKGKKTIVKKTRWIETTDLMEAKNVISAVVLQSIGLGFEESDELTTEKIAEFGISAVSGLLNRFKEETSWADQVENSS